MLISPDTAWVTLLKMADSGDPDSPLRILVTTDLVVPSRVPRSNGGG
ncbi:MAG: hypothetical protein HUU55_06150 [Myxococcales bacterium]|nr:hypothetical protein [Myxococcales bacterium]